MHRLTIAVAISLAAVVPVSAQAESGELVDDLRGIRVALERLVALQEAERQHTEVDILLKRIELRERRMEPVQHRLASTEREVDGLRESLKTLEAMLEQHDDRLEDEIKDGVDAPRSETRRMLEDIRRSMKSQTERLDETIARARMLEDELAEAAEEIEILDDRLAELLGIE